MIKYRDIVLRREGKVYIAWWKGWKDKNVKLGMVGRGSSIENALIDLCRVTDTSVSLPNPVRKNNQR